MLAALAACTVLEGPASAAVELPYQQPQPLGIPGHWKIVLNQDGSRIAATWSIGSTNNTCTSSGTVTVSGHVLQMGVNGQIGNCDELTYPVTNYTYGVFQAQIDAPFDSSGNPLGWWAFWLDGTPEVNWPRTGETDIGELLNEWTTPGVCSTYHWYDPAATTPKHATTSGNHCKPVTSGWHTYAVHWSRHRLAFWYDGRQVLVLSGKFIVDVPNEVRLDITNAVAQQPAVLLVRDVRIWNWI